jgi:hypothetical protein
VERSSGSPIDVDDIPVDGVQVIAVSSAPRTPYR